MQENNHPWHHHSMAAITVCNAEAIIIYMNEKAQQTFAKYGQMLIGQSLFDCHNEQSASTIRKLLKEGGSNIYTILKNGKRKLIHQSAWIDNEGNIGGLTEISMELPDEMPHYNR